MRREAPDIGLAKHIAQQNSLRRFAPGGTAPSPAPLGAPSPPKGARARQAAAGTWEIICDAAHHGERLSDSACGSIQPTALLGIFWRIEASSSPGKLANVYRAGNRRYHRNSFCFLTQKPQMRTY
jgi:hypothetical protein